MHVKDCSKQEQRDFYESVIEEMDEALNGIRIVKNYLCNFTEFRHVDPRTKKLASKTYQNLEDVEDLLTYDRKRFAKELEKLV